MMVADELKEKLRQYSQEHILRYWDELDVKGKDQLREQIEKVDWQQLDRLIDQYVLNPEEVSLPSSIEPAPFFPLHSETPEETKRYKRAKKVGVSMLREGKVAGFTVAGGQGTRLGFDGPKGAYPISPVKGKPLFQLFAEMILRAQEKYSCTIPWYLMTSEANHEQTCAFFEEHDYFGLNSENVMIFKQAMMPAIGFDGKVLLSAPDSMALSPNGHGGSLEALSKSGALADMAERGIEYISYWQVDNPLIMPFDPLFFGLHAEEKAEVSCRGLAKIEPMEKLGNFCIVDGRVEIVEYSDMPELLCRAENEDGTLKFRMGSPAIHIFDRAFVEKLNQGGHVQLPFHRAVKKTPYVSESGEQVKPEEPNAIKLEMFVFDALPLASNVMILEASREEQFGPVKNATGVDSAESSRELYQERCARWLALAGISVPRAEDGSLNCKLELSPRSFLDVDDVMAKADELKSPMQNQEECYE